MVDRLTEEAAEKEERVASLRNTSAKVEREAKDYKAELFDLRKETQLLQAQLLESEKATKSTSKMARSAYAVELDSKAGEIKELRQSVEDMGKKAKAKEEAAAAEAQHQQAEHERQLKELGDQLSLIHV